MAAVAERAGRDPNPAAPPLDEMMLAMDVVDTLRHAERLVERELAADQRDLELKERLREIYRSQGIEVPDRVLDQGVAALREGRFAYRPPPPGMARTLALLWVRRRRWLTGLVLGLAGLAALFAAYAVFFHWPEQRRQAAERQELVEVLPRSMRGELDRIRALARPGEALAAAERLAGAGSAAVDAGDAAAARARLGELRALRELLEQSYVLRIVSRPHQPSGVFRIPAANPRARNYYVIVEALDAQGRPVSVPITSEEDGRTAQVTRFGVRVDQATYDRVRADKLDDGIIQNSRFGEKRRGELRPDYAFPTTGGAILEW
ncbi:DUF6384 family protein [Candidatus Methylocalor cossyra]|uniref:Uncharacterized protein n=1 Tax=Candidatus Methylocalor cossyra TaxID=3108543 RepID=A0ABM9NF19_9GAMM